MDANQQNTALTPFTGPLIVGDAPRPAEPAEAGPAEPTKAAEPAPAADVVAPRRHDATTPKAPPRPRRRGAPRAEDAVALTVRFDPEESEEIDLLVLELRREAGRRRLDKAEVVRELLRLTQEHAGTRRALLRRLQQG